MKKNSMTLFLMGFKGLSTLKFIVNKKLTHLISYVVIANDKNVVKDYYEEIKSFCNEHTIKNVDRGTLSEEHISKYAIAISWRWLIKLTDNKRLIVLHDSLLPKYRGFAPLVNQLINYEKTIGVTALFATKEYDKGEIIEQKSISIEYPLKIAKAIEVISPLYGELVCSILEQLETNSVLKSHKQQESDATYSLWRNNDDYWIDWHKDAKVIKRFIDAVSFPYKGASTNLLNQKIIILDAEIEQDVQIMNRDCGKIIFMKDNFPVIVCGKGLIKIKEAYYEESNQSIFPLKKFRIKFQ